VPVKIPEGPITIPGEPVENVEIVVVDEILKYAAYVEKLSREFEAPFGLETGSVKLKEEIGKITTNRLLLLSTGIHYRAKKG